MNKFFDEYLNIGKIIREKREYKRQMARLAALPADYQYVFKKIQQHMWQFTSGSGYDMLEVHYGLIDLFEAGAADGRNVLDITGEDVAAFCDELLWNTSTYTADWRARLNRDIREKFAVREHGADKAAAGSAAADTGRTGAE